MRIGDIPPLRAPFSPLQVLIVVASIPRLIRGAADTEWVKEQFVNEVANLARFSEGRGVLGLLDEDGKGVATRQQEVAERLQARRLPVVTPDDGRCLLLPTRNIETWLYWLTARRKGEAIAVDETADYKKKRPARGHHPHS